MVSNQEIIKEISVLKDKNIISSDQYSKVIDYYKSLEKTGNKSDSNYSNKFISIVSIIGAILVGAGLILLLGSNRDSISDLIKTILLISVMLATYGIAIYLYFFKDYPRVGYALFLLGSLIYGANIFLIGQIYNVGGSYIEAFGVRALGVLPLAYLLGLSGLLMLGITTFSIYLFSLLFDRYDLPLQYASFSTFGIFVVTNILGLFHSKFEKFKIFSKIYYFISIIRFLLATILEIIYIFEALPVSNSAEYAFPFIIFGIAGLFSISIKYFYEKVQEIIIGKVYGGIGTIMIFISTFILTFEGFNRIVEPGFLLAKKSLWIIVALTILAHNIKYFIDKEKVSDKNSMIDTGFFNIHLAILLSLGFLGQYIQSAMYPFFNIYFLVLLVYMIYIGTRRSNNYLVNLSVLAFVVFLITKYVELFYDMLSGGLFFVVGGIALLLLGFFIEKFRRKLLRGEISLKTV